MTDEDDDYDDDGDDEDFDNVASLPEKDDDLDDDNFDDEEEGEEEEEVDDDDDYGKFKSALGKRNLEDFVTEQTSASSKRFSTANLMPFLNIESGTENAVTTEGILPLLDILELPLTRTCCRSREVASSMTSMPLLHIQQKDRWSCGYRNVQMLLSALIPLLPSDHAYHHCVSSSLKRSDLGVAVPIPSLKDLQLFLQHAWRLGLDPQGAQHYHGNILDKTDQIGAVEVNSLLTAVHIDTVIVQFIKTHESRRLLAPFVWSYFGKCAGCDCRTLNGLPRQSESVATALLDYATSMVLRNNEPKVEHFPSSTICSCPTLPLYLQWEGHSVTVIGIRRILDTEHQLLVLDPAKDGSVIHRQLGHAFDLPSTLHAIEPLILQMTDLSSKDCQIVMATKRALDISEIDAVKGRINALTAARDSVMQSMSLVGATNTTEKLDGDTE